MKKAKDYIEEISPGYQRITSPAYWLTPEGLDNPITAALLRDTLSKTTDEAFKEAFDGATKAEAARYLEQWELCYMGQWGAPELVKAIAYTGRDEALALRAVTMAQSVGELPEVFSTATGIQWAMARGYLIAGNICAWCGVAPGNFGHPHNPLPPTDAPADKVEAVTVTSPSGDKIPGKIPNTTIGKLAIKAAWLIECETGKRATAKQVIERLQSWVDHKDNPEAVTELTGKIANGVMWVTRAGKGRPYDIGACQKALETWNKSRD